MRQRVLRAAGTLAWNVEAGDMASGRQVCWGWACVLVGVLAGCGGGADSTSAPGVSGANEGPDELYDPTAPPRPGPDGVPVGMNSVGDPPPGAAGPVVDWVDVAGASFLFGAQATSADAPRFDPLATPEEGPVREVTVAGFRLSRTEASVSDLRDCIHAGACAGVAQPPAVEVAPSMPATGLSFEEAATLCTFLGGRLPTEMEWELAARAGGEARFPWGDAPECPYHPPGYIQAREQRLRELGEGCPAMFDAVLTGGDAARMEVVADATWMLSPELVTDLCKRVAGQDAAAAADALIALARDKVTEARRTGMLAPGCETVRLETARDGRPGMPPGFIGMAGNAAEWVDGVWSPSDARRVLRGGSYLAVDSSEWRTTARAPSAPDVHLLDVGVRCAHDAVAAP